MPCPQRRSPNGNIGQRVTKKRTQQSRQNVAAHGLGKARCDQEVQPVERREGREYTRPNTTGNCFRLIGQTAQTVFYIMKRARPTAAGPQELARSAQPRPFIAAFENQNMSFVAGRCSAHMFGATLLNPPANNRPQIAFGICLNGACCWLLPL